MFCECLRGVLKAGEGENVSVKTNSLRQTRNWLSQAQFKSEIFLVVLTNFVFYRALLR
jgi:hypothetical protein